MKCSIHRIELPTQFGMKTVNSYILKGRDEVVMLDCGEDSEESRLAMREGLRDLGLVYADIDRLMISHAHTDHIGMCAHVADEAQCEVWVNELVYPWAHSPYEMMLLRRKLFRKNLYQYLKPELRPLFESGFAPMVTTLKNSWRPIDSSLLRIYDAEGPIDICGESWQAMFMPGHCNSMSTFYHPESKTYLSTDMLLNVAPTPLKEPVRLDQDDLQGGILDLLASYDRLLGMELGMIYPGHYEPFDHGHDMIHQQLKRIHHRKDQTLELIKSGVHDFTDIFNHLYKGKIFMPAIIMTIGYVELLQAEDRITVEEVDGYRSIKPKEVLV